jgi:hypothetical protein
VPAASWALSSAAGASSVLASAALALALAWAVLA